MSLLTSTKHDQTNLDFVKQNLEYNEKTGVFTWIKNQGRHYFVGKDAGCVEKKRGYVRIRLNNVDYLAHRLAWFYVYGSYPSGQIDHINGNPSDNRIQNLRVATPPENSQNQKQRQGTKSKIRNVYLSGKKYLVQITAFKKYYYFGTYDDIDLAELIATEAREKYHGRFARNA